MHTWEWQVNTVSKLQEWLRHSSSSQPLLADGSAEQSLLPFQQSQDGPSESHTSVATQSQWAEDCSTASPHNAGVYHGAALLVR